MKLWPEGWDMSEGVSADGNKGPWLAAPFRPHFCIPMFGFPPRCSICGRRM